ncbi:MAG: hypothetical protein J6P02_06400 [Lachnospiraceae bacterium]|nr:hypothetical protein [Lachnospiraceae bacterium]
MIYIIVLLLIALIPAHIAKNKGYNFGLWYVYGIFLWIVALIHSLVLKDKSEEIKKETEAEKRIIEKQKSLKKTITTANRLIDIIELLNNGILTKDEFISQKNKMWPEIEKRLERTTDLSIIKNAYDKELITEKEYKEIKEETLNPVKTITWIVKFDNSSILDHTEVEAPLNATKNEIEQIVRKENYTSQIKRIYPKPED